MISYQLFQEKNWVIMQDCTQGGMRSLVNSSRQIEKLPILQSFLPFRLSCLFSLDLYLYNLAIFLIDPNVQKLEPYNFLLWHIQQTFFLFILQIFKPIRFNFIVNTIKIVYNHSKCPIFSLSLIYPPRPSHYFSALTTEKSCHSQTSLLFPVDSLHFSKPMINEAINFNKIKGHIAPPSYQQSNPAHKLQVPQSFSPFACFHAEGNPLVLNFLQHVPLLTFRFITLLLQTVILILALLAKIEQKEAFPKHSGRE